MPYPERLEQAITKCERYALTHHRGFKIQLINLEMKTKPAWSVSFPSYSLPAPFLFFQDEDLLRALEQLVAAIENEPYVPLNPTGTAGTIGS